MPRLYQFILYFSLRAQGTKQDYVWIENLHGVMHDMQWKTIMVY